ncbi:MAG: EboA domain-containing protein [Gammaproteobacteria bacterium]
MRAEVQPASPAIRKLLRGWLARRVEAKALAWLDGQHERLAASAPDYIFFAAFSAVPRHTGKLRLSAEDTQLNDDNRAHWAHWRVDQAGRTLLLLAVDSGDAEAYAGKLQKLSSCADLDELIALYQSLPLLPHRQRLRALAAEGARSNMTAVFNAVALCNAYPAEHFDDGAWNQLVLKALFVESPLHLIEGLDRRANPELARMLVDYAHERWAAKRRVSPELWRPVGPYADDSTVSDLEKVLADPDPLQQRAAALALLQSACPRAAEVLARRADLRAAIAQGRLSWRVLAGGETTI